MYRGRTAHRRGIVTAPATPNRLWHGQPARATSPFCRPPALRCVGPKCRRCRSGGLSSCHFFRRGWPILGRFAMEYPSGPSRASCRVIPTHKPFSFHRHILRKSISHVISYTSTQTKNVEFFDICFHTHLQTYLHFRGSPFFRAQDPLRNQITPCISKTWIFGPASSKTSNYLCYL